MLILEDIWQCIAYNTYKILFSLNIINVKYHNIRLGFRYDRRSSAMCIKYGGDDKSNL